LNLPKNLVDTIKILATEDNPLFVIAALCVFAWLCIKCRREKTSTFERGLLIYTAMLFLMFAFMGGSDRYEPIFLPFLAMCLAVGIVDLQKISSGKFVHWSLIVFALAALCYCFNTHLNPQPLGWVGVTYSEAHGHDYGLNELDAYLRQILGPLPPLERPQTLEDLVNIGEPLTVPRDANKIIIFDAKFHWFATWWYLERLTVYHRAPIYSTSAPASQKILVNFSLNRAALPTPLTPVYFIYVVSPSFKDPQVANAKWPDILVRHLDAEHVPYVTIYSDEGEAMFRVYNFDTHQ
jgi:hypothetical protein